MGYVIEALTSTPPARVVGANGVGLLTPREEEVVNLVAQGIGAAEIQAQLQELQSAIVRSAEILDGGAQSGMEVSQPQPDLIQANDSLTKARVAVHSFRVNQVKKEAKWAKMSRMNLPSGNSSP